MLYNTIFLQKKASAISRYSFATYLKLTYFSLSSFSIFWKLTANNKVVFIANTSVFGLFRDLCFQKKEKNCLTIYRKITFLHNFCNAKSNKFSFFSFRWVIIFKISLAVTNFKPVLLLYRIQSFDLLWNATLSWNEFKKPYFNY